MRRVVIMGAAGRDFHVFSTVFRDDPTQVVVAFTAAQIPDIADRRYPAELAGDRYPTGIPILGEDRLGSLVREEAVDEVVFAYSDISHVEVMHRASRVLAAGADFRLVGPGPSMLTSTVPVVAVCATRTGAGKSQTCRVVARSLRVAGYEVAWIRHPMPYGDLVRERVQRFASAAELDAAGLTIEEREEYELPVAEGFVVWAGVDYGDILRRAETEADVVLWDGGNNDFPFLRPDLQFTVLDALRPGHEVTYHPGEVNLLLADAVVINKVDLVEPAVVEAMEATVRDQCGDAVPIVRAASEVTLASGPEIEGRRVLVVEDGPSLTHGGLATGAGYAAATAAGAEVVDPRPFAVGAIAATFDAFPQLGPVVPAMGYSPEHCDDLAATIDNANCDAVVAGTPMDLDRLLRLRTPVRRVGYELREVSSPTIADILAQRRRRDLCRGRVPRGHPHPRVRHHRGTHTNQRRRGPRSGHLRRHSADGRCPGAGRAARTARHGDTSLDLTGG
jgi:predicted GTPase